MCVEAERRLRCLWLYCLGSISFVIIAYAYEFRLRGESFVPLAELFFFGPCFIFNGFFLHQRFGSKQILLDLGLSINLKRFIENCWAVAEQSSNLSTFVLAESWGSRCWYCLIELSAKRFFLICTEIVFQLVVARSARCVRVACVVAWILVNIELVAKVVCVVQFYILAAVVYGIKHCFLERFWALIWLIRWQTISDHFIEVNDKIEHFFLLWLLRLFPNVGSVWFMALLCSVK